MSSKEKQTKIGFVGLHQLMRTGFILALGESGYSLFFTYESSEELATSFATDGLPEVVFVEADRDEATALKAVCWLREHHPTVKMLALSLEAEEASIKPLLDNGAHGYVCKASEPREIDSAIQTVLKKGAYLPPLNPWSLRRCI